MLDALTSDSEINRFHSAPLLSSSCPIISLSPSQAEYERTVRVALEIKRAGHLLEDQPALAASIKSRFSYLDPLNHLQVSGATTGTIYLLCANPRCRWYPWALCAHSRPIFTRHGFSANSFICLVHCRSR